LKFISKLDKLEELYTDIEYDTIEQLKYDIKIQRINEILK